AGLFKIQGGTEWRRLYWNICLPASVGNGGPGPEADRYTRVSAIAGEKRKKEKAKRREGGKTSRQVTCPKALLVTACASSLTRVRPPRDQHMIALISILIPAYGCYRLGVWPSLAPERDYGRR